MIGFNPNPIQSLKSKEKSISTIPKITDEDIEVMTYKEKQQFYKYRSTLGIARKSTHTFRKVAKI